MLIFILKRLGVMLLTMFALTLVVFYLTNLEPNLVKLALSAGNMRMTPEEVQLWLENRGYTDPFFYRYFSWLGGVLTGDWGMSTRFDTEVGPFIAGRLAATGALMFWVMIVMIPSALLLGVLAGMREGSKTDRSLSLVAIGSTATPEYVSGIIFTVIFASLFKEWFGDFHLNGSAASATGRNGLNITFYNFTLPVITMAAYGMGYIARMTRASMAEVMTAQYIRTARLKGVSFRQIVIKHALRNALIAPFTVIMLQFPWLLTGVVIVERMFGYKGFGDALVQAAENNDIELLLTCSVVSVAVVLITQLISDIGYVYLNPRIRVK
ncbi:ABC transporter permease [Pontivivens insulae]|uniref:Oligopeptide transport system permease protein OppB n=1 Tax=Pontivivens insulae TaxID=1639689 RepID=A0A2R8AAA6_9RHOB|nr:ABC transporter permease [Pontivivens insulae]RED13049.1 peptide/nickel transport system permease protein [Pontivivens insulae]SPF29141.1 Oligopeptide transport system permease protein OppB [Pontivivens insulae]